MHQLIRLFVVISYVSVFGGQNFFKNQEEPIHLKRLEIRNKILGWTPEKVKTYLGEPDYLELLPGAKSPDYYYFLDAIIDGKKYIAAKIAFSRSSGKVMQVLWYAENKKYIRDFEDTPPVDFYSGNGSVFKDAQAPVVIHNLLSHTRKWTLQELTKYLGEPDSIEYYKGTKIVRVFAYYCQFINDGDNYGGIRLQFNKKGRVTSYLMMTEECVEKNKKASN